MRANPWTRDVNFDWDEPSKVIRSASTRSARACSASRRRSSRSYLNTVLSGQP
jgi:hypothetical protein